MEQIIESVKPMTDTEPLTVTGREAGKHGGVLGVIFMQMTLTVFFLLAAVILSIMDRDLFSHLKDEFIRLTNKDTEEFFISIMDYMQSLINL